MPMMMVDDASYEKELNKLSPGRASQLENKDEPQIITSLDLAKVVSIQRGRPAGTLEIPNSIRALAAEEAICGTPAKDISKAFGISKSSVSAYKNDATSTASYDKPNEQLAEANKEVRDEISSTARAKLKLALDNITETKIVDAKLRDIAQVAQAMSGIVKNLEPQGPTNLVQNQVIVYRPKQTNLDDFDIITVNE